ncbi:hypothetical protein [Paraglaciecola aestuariivivens]
MKTGISLLGAILVSFVTSIQAAPFELATTESLKFAKVALTDADYNNDGHVVISNSTDVLDLVFAAGFGLSTDHRYIRIDIINGAFNTNFPASGISSSLSYDSRLVSGGAIGDQSLIIEISANPAIGPDTLLTLENNSFLWFDIDQPIEVHYRLYDTATAAVNEGNYLSNIQSTLATFNDAIGDKYVRSFTHKVGIGHDFLRFNSTFRSPATFSLGDANETLASVAKILFNQLILEDVLLASTSEPINDFRLLIPTIDTASDTVSLNGDFSTARYFLNQDDDCSGTSLELAAYSSDRVVMLSIDDLVDHPVFCIAAESNEIAIQRSAYQIDLDIGVEAKLFGEVVYDAATIVLPYITGYTGYRQRILLVNHAGYDVKYFTEFTAEESVEGNYIVNDVSKGIISAGSTLKINAQDLVTINEGVPSRVSARIFVDAKPKDISAAVQILSLGSELPPHTNVLEVIEY